MGTGRVGPVDEIMDLTAEQRQRLVAVGLSESQLQRFCDGQEVAFDFPTDLSQGIALIQLNGQVLRYGILEINDPGSGFIAFIRFRQTAFDLARAFGLEEVEIFGMSVINAELRELLDELIVDIGAHIGTKPPSLMRNLRWSVTKARWRT